jgi:hypothetical protein
MYLEDIGRDTYHEYAKYHLQLDNGKNIIDRFYKYATHKIDNVAVKYADILKGDEGDGMVYFSYSDAAKIQQFNREAQGSSGIKKFANMDFAYGNNKRPDFKSSTTIDAIVNGERTATTRYSNQHADYYADAKVGDLIEFKDKQGRKAWVRVTKPLTKLNPPADGNWDAFYETWGKKEGWSKEYFNKNVKHKIEDGIAWQLEYEFVAANGQFEDIAAKAQAKVPVLKRVISGM